MSSDLYVLERVSYFAPNPLVLQNNGKEMYKKSVLNVQSCFLAN